MKAILLLVAVVAAVFVPSATSGQRPTLTAHSSSFGKAIFDGYCARCHTQGWSYGDPGVPGQGAFGDCASSGGLPLAMSARAARTAERARKAGFTGLLQQPSGPPRPGPRG